MRRALVIVLLLGAGMESSCTWPAALRKRVRIGTNHSPDFNYHDAQGRPVGFAIDVMNAAAQRAGLELEWVAVQTDPEETFRRGQADLWPVVTYFEQRRERLHMTEPWWRLATVMYSPEDRAIRKVGDLEGRSVVLTSPSRRYLPNMKFPPSTQIDIVASPYLGMLRMCQGKADAAMVDLRVGDQALLNRPPECGSRRMVGEIIEEAVREFSIGARFGYEREADALRAAIDDIALDGEVVKLATKWKFIDQTDTALISWLEATRRKSDRWRGTVMILGVVVILGLITVILLQRARSRAEASAEARAQFLANMSHELRTPMHGVLGLTELALGAEMPAEQRQLLTLARDSAERLLHVVDDVLDLSRIESGKLELEQIPFDPRELVNRAQMILSLRAQEKALALRAEVDDTVPPLLAGDPSRIHQILINLLNNAIKFTDRGNVLLRVGGEMLSGERYRISFAVEDSGIGIPPEHRQRIFESFTQADASTTRRYGGSGLGLAISSHLVRMMGGSIGLLSEVGKGSTFHFELELPVAAPARDAAPLPAEIPRRPLSLLVADDNVVNRTLLERMLAKSGHAVASVENGEQAIAALAAHPFDAVLMDVHMPVLDGLEATRRIRDQESRNSPGVRVPIIALTALAFREDAVRCREAGMDAYLAKPFKTGDLLKLLAQLEDQKVASPEQRTA